MKTLQTLFSEALRVENLLDYQEYYLAHIPRDNVSQLKSETLGEHMNVVLKIAEQICTINDLFPIIDKLVEETTILLGFSDLDKALERIKEMFINTIVFHDFGKVNEHFQLHRMNNGDPLFKGSFPEIFKPKHGHSELGGFIYMVYHLEKYNLNQESEKDEDDNVKLSVLAFLFCNTILLHHSPKLIEPTERVVKSQFIKIWPQLNRYIKLYKDFPDIHYSEFYFDKINDVIQQLEQMSSNFALFALLRLNFSLLTAADYLATGQYSYNILLEGERDWGILSQDQRNRIILAAEKEKNFNQDAYNLFNSGGYVFKNPQVKSEHNLNILRNEMIISVLHEIRNHGDKRIFYIEAPTGGGKTNLSMLAVAELLKARSELNKVFYVFPFTTLISQTHKAIKETLRLYDDEIALLHSKIGFQTTNQKENKLSEEESEDGIYGNRRRNFLQNLFVLYPFTLITHIRFFEIIKSNLKEEIYLMHRLANSIVVIDELQSYNPKHWDKIMYMLDQYGKYFNIRFILMSATLPRLDKINTVRIASPQMPIVHDLLPDAKKYFINPNFQGRVSFNFELLEDKCELNEESLAIKVIEKSEERANKFGRVFTIVEFIFKKTATSFQEEINRQKKFFDEIFVLSGTILEHRRKEIIYFIKRNKKTQNLRILLITTQVVEAGVDIDMDLGFKNISLIDSDEQLAGRVNRNVTKENCEVYLFQLNEPNILYGNDMRYKITKEFSTDFHKNILETKDFKVLYNRVFTEIDAKNESAVFENFMDDYLGYFKKLDFQQIHSKFQLIEQDTLSVFVPLNIPLEIENEEGSLERIFTDFELAFLKDNLVFSKSENYVNGEKVWSLFRKIMDNPIEDFISKKIEKKVIYGILSKFTFSIFNTEKIRKSLEEYSNPELSFSSYIYLSQHRLIFQIDTGLMESKFNSSENCIL
jgi:CRISPR-associated endonuclease/helicase Cas3